MRQDALCATLAVCGIIVGSYGWRGFFDPDPSRWPLALIGGLLSLLALVEFKRAS